MGNRFVNYLKKRLPVSRRHRKPKLGGTIGVLPPELVEAIAKYLNARDNSSLRLCGTYITACTSNYFEKAFLSVIYTDLSVDSLHKLDNASQDPHFASRIQRLVFRREEHMSFGAGWEWRREGPSDAEHSFPQVSPLSPTGDGQEYLHKILSRLVNCKSFTITGNPIRQPVGRWPLSYESVDEMRSRLSPGDVLALLFHLMCANTVKVRELDVDYDVAHAVAVQGHSLWPYIEERGKAYRFPDGRCGSPWSQIESLIVRNTGLIVRFPGQQMRTILELSTGLRRLHISLDKKYDAGGFYMLQPKCIRDCEFQLEELRLENGAIGSYSDFQDPTPLQVFEYLPQFLHKFRGTLRKVHFGNLTMRLEGPGWKPILEYIRDNLTRLEEITLVDLAFSVPIDPWPQSKKVAALDFPELSINPIVDGVTRSKFTYSSYTSWDPDGDIVTGRVSYSGPNMNAALQKLLDCAQVGPSNGDPSGASFR